jgi:acyl-CoA synthetase (AMP-forming)/AMP-acid ligase II
VILQLENIQDVVVSGKPNPITGSVVVARVTLFSPEDPMQVEDRVLAHCARQLPPFKIPALVQVDEAVLHNERFKKVRVTDNDQQT